MGTKRNGRERDREMLERERETVERQSEAEKKAHRVKDVLRTQRIKCALTIYKQIPLRPTAIYILSNPGNPTLC